MAVTRLIRKTRKNRARSNNRVENINRFIKQPVIKRVDVEEIKKEFEATSKGGKKAAAKKEEAPKAEAVATEEVAAEKPAKKATKKAAEKKDEE